MSRANLQMEQEGEPLIHSIPYMFCRSQCPPGTCTGVHVHVCVCFSVIGF